MKESLTLLSFLLACAYSKCDWCGQDLVGPFYSLRTVLAPVIESYILLDRLLYVKEQAELEERITAALIPIFEPSTSPRNMAIVAYRCMSTVVN